MRSPPRPRRRRTPRGVVEVLLVRHGEVTSHAGDVPISGTGLDAATAAGERLIHPTGEDIRALTSASTRARQSVSALLLGQTASTPGRQAAHGPEITAGLRNPDLYLAGQRVEMVSTSRDLAAQVPELTPQTCERHPFFGPFLTAPDRVGWWLRHGSPPGEDARSVAMRVESFARSLTDRDEPGLVVAVTHSPVLRAVALALTGADPGEPAFLSGYRILVDKAGYLDVSRVQL